MKVNKFEISFTNKNGQIVEGQTTKYNVKPEAEHPWEIYQAIKDELTKGLRCADRDVRKAFVTISTSKGKFIKEFAPTFYKGDF